MNRRTFIRGVAALVGSGVSGVFGLLSPRTPTPPLSVKQDWTVKHKFSTGITGAYPGGTVLTESALSEHIRRYLKEAHAKIAEHQAKCFYSELDPDVWPVYNKTPTETPI